MLSAAPRASWRLNTFFNALFAHYHTRQLCCVCCAAPLLCIALQITSDVNGAAKNGSDASNVVGDAREEQKKEKENEEEENQEEVGEDEEEEEEENTDDEDDVPCPDGRIDGDVVKCDIACEEAGLLGCLSKQKRADWVEQGGVCSLYLEPTVFCIARRSAGHRSQAEVAPCCKRVFGCAS